ncbi:MAG: hypothetical protein V4773_13765, partial [Verrucomicrobiota bacterium]
MRLQVAFQICVCLLVAALINSQWRFPAPAGAEKLTYAVEITATPSRATDLQLYYNRGSGYSEEQTSRSRFPEPNKLQTCQLSIPEGTYRSLRLDPLDAEGSITIDSIRIVDSRGRVVTAFSPGDFRPLHHIRVFKTEGGILTLTTTPGETDPQIETTLSPIAVPQETLQTKLAQLHLGRGALLFLGLLTLVFALDRLAPATRALEASQRWATAHPRLAITVVAALAALASSYPVVFLGKSYVSPDTSTTLLYGSFPTLPAYETERQLDTKGSDVGAIMWQHVPYAVTQRRALSGGELPLWNRYTSGGTPLLAQGQSMFGDPLHFIPIVCNSAAWAWDIKYVAAKLLLALGLGLCVWTLTASLPASLLVALASPFIGFFVFRINHPAIFSLCYSPWIAFAWLKLGQASDLRQRVLGAVLLMAANCSTLTSGTVKEAYCLLLGLNFSGLCALFFSGQPARSRIRSLACAGIGLALAVGATSPVWATFFHTLKSAHTSYASSVAYQIQPSLLLGAFDEAFYRPLSVEGYVYNPSLNFLLSFGLIYFLVSTLSGPRNSTMAV